MGSLRVSAVSATLRRGSNDVVGRPVSIALQRAAKLHAATRSTARVAFNDAMGFNLPDYSAFWKSDVTPVSIISESRDYRQQTD